MALQLKNQPTRNAGQPQVAQSIKVSRAAATLPQTSTHQLFQVRGGRVLVRLLLGEVTTIIQNSDPVIKISSKKLNAAMDTAVGTAVDVASTVAITSDEVGTLYVVEGDGTAIIPSDAGAAFIGSQGGSWIAPNGEIYLTTGASKTGAIKWDLWYEPLDAGATVVPIDVATAAV